MPSASKRLFPWCLLPSIVATLALNAAQDGLDLLTPARPSVFPFPTNTSSSASNLTSLGAGPHIHCDDAEYGNPPVASCRDAVDQLPRDPYALIGPALSFGPRGPGAHWAVSLPARHISCGFSLSSSATIEFWCTLFVLTHCSGWEMHHRLHPDVLSLARPTGKYPRSRGDYPETVRGDRTASLRRPSQQLG